MTENIMKRYLLEQVYEKDKITVFGKLSELQIQNKLYELFRNDEIKIDENHFNEWLNQLNNSKQLFASKYSLYLPTEEELTNYIKKERELLERKYIGISEEYEEKDINNNKSIKGAKNETTKKSKSK